MEITQGDLFAHLGEKAVLGHAISKDLRMGAGIAPLFLKNVAGMTRDELRKQVPEIGKTVYFQAGPTLIGNLITKTYYYDKPTQANFSRTVANFYTTLAGLNLDPDTVVYLPKIGAGLDKLDLLFVLKTVQENALRTKLKTVMVFLPSDVDYGRAQEFLAKTT